MSFGSYAENEGISCIDITSFKLKPEFLLGSNDNDCFTSSSVEFELKGTTNDGRKNVSHSLLSPVVM